MKTLTAKMLISLVGVALAAPFLATALIIGARAVALAQNGQDDLLLVALAFGGAAASMLNGFGRRTTKAERKERGGVETNADAGPRHSSLINLGY